MVIRRNPVGEVLHECSFPKLFDGEQYQMNILEIQTLGLPPRGTKSQSSGKGVRRVDKAKSHSGDFPSGPVAETQHSQCRGPRLDPWSGN